MIYKKGETFPKKPAKIMMHNSNLMYVIYPCRLDRKDILETFFQNTAWKDHKVDKGDKDISFLVDEELRFKISPNEGRKHMPDIFYARDGIEIGRGNEIPVWLFGFLY